VNKLQMITNVLKGIVAPTDIKLVHGTTQSSNETPKFIDVCICSNAMDDETWDKCQETLEQAKSALREAGLVDYRPYKGTIYFLNHPGEQTTIQTSALGPQQLTPTTLKEASLQEIAPQVPVFVEVKHKLEYPLARWDCVEIAEADARYDIKPRKFCQAAIVATPKAALT